MFLSWDCIIKMKKTSRHSSLLQWIEWAYSLTPQFKWPANIFKEYFVFLIFFEKKPHLWSVHMVGFVWLLMNYTQIPVQNARYGIWSSQSLFIRLMIIRLPKLETPVGYLGWSQIDSMLNFNQCMAHQSPLLNFLFIEEVFECLCRRMKCKPKTKKQFPWNISKSKYDNVLVILIESKF